MPTKVEPIAIKLTNVRLSFPHLQEPSVPKDNPEAEPKYRAAFILDPTDSEHRKIIKQIKAEHQRLVEETFGGKRVKMKELDCYGDGNDKISDKTGEIYDGYEDMFFVQANNSRRPHCLLPNKDPIDQKEISRILYPGCYVNASINLWIQDNTFGKAVRISLRGVQFRRDGEEFGGSNVDLDKEFDDFSDDDYPEDDDDLI